MAEGSKASKKANVRGILKHTPGFVSPEQPQDARATKSMIKRKSAHYDEMNILETLHPSNKDYGHMKVLEPKTPYNFEMKEADPLRTVDHEELLKRLQNVQAGKETPKAMQPPANEEDEMTEEERKKRKDFEEKRKQHYNEYQAVLASKKKDAS